MKIKDNKSIKEWIIEDIRKDLRLWRGTLIGLAAGYMISFFFQPEIVRVKLGLFGYISEFFDILFSFDDKMSARIAATAWLSMCIGGSIGAVIEKRLIEKGKIKAWSRKTKDE